VLRGGCTSTTMLFQWAVGISLHSNCRTDAVGCWGQHLHFHTRTILNAWLRHLRHALASCEPACGVQRAVCPVANAVCSRASGDIKPAATGRVCMLASMWPTLQAHCLCLYGLARADDTHASRLQMHVLMQPLTQSRCTCCALSFVRCRARRYDTAVTPTSSLPLHRLVCHLLGLVRRMFCVAAPVASNSGENQEGELKFESGSHMHAVHCASHAVARHSAICCVPVARYIHRAICSMSVARQSYISLCIPCSGQTFGYLLRASG
jgi:hypothetical protein